MADGTLSEELPAAHRLSDYACALRYEDLPSNVVDLARQCLIDAIACVAFGRTLSWSKIVIDQLRPYRGTGSVPLPGLPEIRVAPGMAALAAGVCAHAFELDSLRKPGAGVHPGATVALPALIMAHHAGVDGKRLLTAIAAGCEVMFRIGAATLHTPESRGFHAPGITGPFGAATAAAVILGLPPAQLASALGIAGSLSGGILAFSKARSGAMVKRLHLGRAAESGILAAELAAAGFEGPETVLDGKFGTLEAYCEGHDKSLLTAGLGERFEIEKLCIKRYACHVTAHPPVQLLREWMADHAFTGDDIDGIDLRSTAKIISHHNERRPGDLASAQYSVPYMVASAAYVDPEDPAALETAILGDAAIRDLAIRIVVGERAGKSSGWGSDLTVRLKDGRVFSGAADGFLGCPETPFSRAQLRTKFLRLWGASDEVRADILFDRLSRVEEAEKIDLGELDCFGPLRDQADAEASEAR